MNKGAIAAAVLGFFAGVVSIPAITMVNDHARYEAITRLVGTSSVAYNLEVCGALYLPYDNRSIYVGNFVANPGSVCMLGDAAINIGSSMVRLSY